MSKLRIVVSLLILAVVLGCAGRSHSHDGFRTSAAIKVHADASVDQDTVMLQARTNGAATPISWTADTGRHLMIEWEDPGQKCIVGKSCKDNKCSAVTNTALAARTECRYKVWLDNTVAHDPIVVVDNCCP